MEQINIKYNNLVRAYAVLVDSIEYYKKLLEMPKETVFAGKSLEKLVETAQRSLIQAFYSFNAAIQKNCKNVYFCDRF